MEEKQKQNEINKDSDSDMEIVDDSERSTLEEERKYYKKLTETLRKELKAQHEQYYKSSSRGRDKRESTTNEPSTQSRIWGSLRDNAISLGVYAVAMGTISMLGMANNSGLGGLNKPTNPAAPSPARHDIYK